MRSGLFGWIGFAETESRMRDVLDGMACGAAIGEHWLGASAGLALASRIGEVELAREDGVIVAVAGAPRLAAQEPADTALTGRTAAALARAYRRHGAALLDGLSGAFALAILRPETDELLLAVDRIAGRHPLSYKIGGDGTVIFATNGDSIEAHPQGSSPLDPQGIFDYLYYHVVPAPRTARRDVLRLLPGCCLERRGERVEVRRYWQPEYREHDATPLEQLEREFRELLRDGVRQVSNGANVGCFLSGGTDSSAVAGTLSEVSGRPVKSYSIGFEAQGYDEMEYARTAARHFGIEHHESYLSPDDVVETIPRIARACSEPFGNESAVPTYHCARMAQEDGIERLLAGDGGDELFAGNPPCAMQKVFGLYEKVPALLRSMLEPVVFGFPGGEHLLPIRKARGYIRQAKVPMPRRAQAYTYIERLGTARMIHPEFLAEVDVGEPLRLLDETYHGARAESMLNRMLASSLRFTLADNDLPKVSRMCDLAGVQVAYPLLSDELVAFSLRLPLRHKMRGFKLRWFYKHALRDFLPKKILTKSKHGFGMPFGMWMRDHPPLQQIAMDSVHDLKSRRIVREDLIDDVVRLHREDHAVYYGVLIWVLMQLEQWLKAHLD